MSQDLPRMSNTEKSMLALGIVGTFIALCVLVLGDNIVRLITKPDIYLSTNTVSLEDLGSTKEHVRLFDYYNGGAKASVNTKIVAAFANPDIKFKVESDEEVKISAKRGGIIEISLERFSPRAHLKISVLSQTDNQLLETFYIDDEGKNPINPDRREMGEDKRSRVLAVFVVVMLLVAMMRIFINRLEKRILTDWNAKSIMINDKISEIKADIGDLKERDVDEDTRKQDNVEPSNEVGARLKAMLRPQRPA